MLRSLALLVALFASSAQAADIAQVYARWEQLRDPKAESIRFEEGRAFLEVYPGWPEEKLIRNRTEAAALLEAPDKDVMKKFCATPPVTGRGMVACAIAEAGTMEQQVTWVKQGWRQGDFTADEESRIVKRYPALLTRAEHNARMDRLLYEGKSTAAKRMLPIIGTDQRKAFEVRLAFITNNKKAPKLVDTLSAAQRRDAGVLYERARWRAKKSDHAGLAELITAAGKDAPYPDLWWPLRARAAREALEDGNIVLALKALEHHGELKPEAMAEALWFKGWILLRHSKNAGEAYKQFYALYTGVTTPVSKARAAYWAARAAEVNGNKDIAAEWWEKAAEHPTVFYGQLAISKLRKGKPLTLPDAPEPTNADKKSFLAEPMVAASRMLAKAGDTERRDLFITTQGMRITSPGQHALLASLGREIAGTHMGVEAAKLALRDSVTLIHAGWPTMKLPVGLPIEQALTLAITRQESEFNPTARSPANAQGLMQLLPGTAKQEAKKLDMPFAPADILDPATNQTLGSSYLGRLIAGFDGSYILGIASYNAGPGSARKWIKANGMPPKDIDGAIDWIESIPFGETRNYVMRVLENVSVYRTLADPKAPLTIEQDLVR